MHVIRSKGSAVHALALLSDDVFVVRKGDEQQVEVYDARSFDLRRHITVPRLGGGSLAVAACAHHSCLYVSASDQDSVHRVGSVGRKKTKKSSGRCLRVRPASPSTARTTWSSLAAMRTSYKDTERTELR